MTSKLGDSPRKSAAAYLLFYRRRSDKPLGPQYLQDLVSDFRNPPQQQTTSNSADESYESDSGEGRLGGPSSILRGSSSNSIAAGAAATKGLQPQGPTALRDAGSGSAGQSAARSLRPTTQATSDDEGIGMEDDDDDLEVAPLKAPSGSNRQYGNFGNTAWDFASLEQRRDNNADSGAEMLLDSVEDRGPSTTHHDDADSTAAEQDDEDDDRDRFIDDLLPIAGSASTPASDDQWNELEETISFGDAAGYEYEDADAAEQPHTSDAYVDSLHLEDSRMAVDDGDGADPPAVDIRLPDEGGAGKGKVE